MLPFATPNQLARVAPYWSTESAGSRRPWPTSSGPLLATIGGGPKKSRPWTAPPMPKCIERQPWTWRCSERLVARACSSSNRLVRVPVISARKLLIAVVEPNRVPALPSRGTGPVVATLYWTAVLPARKTLLPDALMQVRVEVPLPDWNRSPIRPPHPEGAPSGLEACQKLCWSLWLNNLGGSCTLRAV